MKLGAFLSIFILSSLSIKANYIPQKLKSKVKGIVVRIDEGKKRKYTTSKQYSIGYTAKVIASNVSKEDVTLTAQLFVLGKGKGREYCLLMAPSNTITIGAGVRNKEILNTHHKDSVKKSKFETSTHTVYTVEASKYPAAGVCLIIKDQEGKIVAIRGSSVYSKFYSWIESKKPGDLFTSSGKVAKETKRKK